MALSHTLAVQSGIVHDLLYFTVDYFFNGVKITYVCVVIKNELLQKYLKISISYKICKQMFCFTTNLKMVVIIII